MGALADATLERPVPVDDSPYPLKDTRRFP
jgi:hypothetical protein